MADETDAADPERPPPDGEPAPDEAAARILILCFGELAALVPALGAIAAIRAHHADSHVTLVTGSAHADLMAAAAAADAVWACREPMRFGPAWWLLVRRLRRARFDRVYDLDGSRRSTALARWSGARRPPEPRSGEGGRHVVDRLRHRLQAAGIMQMPDSDLSRVEAETGALVPDQPCVLMVPRGAAPGPGDRWPIAKYAVLARRLTWAGLIPVVIGDAGDAALGAAIVARTPETRDLTAQTRCAEIVALARRARGAVGGSAGPMHLIAAAGCPCLVLFSEATDPAACAPRPGAAGGRVASLRRPTLDSLSVDEVERQLPFAL